MPSQWFIVQTLSGQEQKVKDSIEKRIKTEEMQDTVYNGVSRYKKCKWGSGLLKSRLCFLTSKKHKQDYKQRGTTTWG